MTTVYDEAVGRTTSVLPCRVCGKPVYFSLTENGKRCPYDLVDGRPTRTSHFTSCANVREWTAAHPKKASGEL
jgi:hypothetical protein